uniref:Uncharacterized protein n=1 Tax=Arundo donax TaxID=35708 RepID=A0A0A9CEF3_ARUDO
MEVLTNHWTDWTAQLAKLLTLYKQFMNCDFMIMFSST